MPINLRQQQIADLVNARGEQSVEALAGKFLVSGMTIRRDLQALAEAGHVLRTHGGAAPARRVTFDFQFLERAKTHWNAKQQIAAAAAELVRDGQSVMLDSSTTTLAIAEHLRTRSRLTVVTTSLPIASALQHSPGMEVLLLGGYLRPDAPDLAGPLTEGNIESLRVDVAFLGADGIDAKGAIYNAAPAVARMLGKMAASAKTVYAVADSSKLGRTALARFGNVSAWAGLVTDSGVAKPLTASLRRAGVKLIIAPKTS
ncbi:MAG: DeoR/GlpR family DNA-binding transcription regulator [Planctomycetota bacterium]|nr:DeoR/GlpR family DNA-binding transcription regulator [Planctomycetota bacterium]